MVDNFIQNIREESPTLQKKIFLNHASRGPLHGITQKAIQEYSEYWGEFDFEESNKVFQEARGKFGKLINAKEEEIVFTRDVTSGSRLAANMINYDDKSNIVCYWNDYVAQVYQALFLKKTKNIEYRPVPDQKNCVVAEEFANKIDKNTKLVLLSHVQWLSGCRADVKEIAKIAHENDALIAIDSIQSSGALVNDVKEWGVDFLTCGTAKWLLGANQAGYFYIKEDHISEFDPPFAGYHGVDPGSHDQPYWNVNELIYVEGVSKFMDTNPSDFLFLVKVWI
ncbi:MAG: aminotransferase class V-fold PLP-dependent enzyme [Candidatus Heimdallarchaeota archaeon]|nr:aminotransferase class V-fold PLP-dependent enzyme [Candidatus Heimdallarchaeota archaeon]